MSAAPGCVPDETSYGLSKVWEGRRETTGCFFFVVFCFPSSLLPLSHELAGIGDVLIKLGTG